MNFVRRREWKDLGQKSDVGISPTKQNKPYYPSLYVNSKQVGNLNVSAGDEIVLNIRAKVTSINASSREGADAEISYSLDLLKMKTGGKAED